MPLTSVWQRCRGMRVWFGPFFYWVIVLTSQDAIFVPGQRSHKAKNRRKHFRGKIGWAISNLVAVLVSDLWAMAGKNGTVFFNNWPPSWMCHSDRTGCWTWVSPHRKEAMSLISAQFYHMPGRYERVCVGWYCAKVKGHAELKNRKIQSKDLYLRFPQITPFQPQQFRW